MCEPPAEREGSLLIVSSDKCAAHVGTLNTSRPRLTEAIHLLRADPDLAAGIPPQELGAATERAVAAAVQIDPPSWDPTYFRTTATVGWLGLMVTDGLMLRCVTIGRRSSCELFGPGDLMRPWDADGEYDPLSVTVHWRVMEPSRVAVLNDHFALRVSRWPTISAQLLSRVARRARYLGLTHTVTHLPRMDDRLLLLFWLLAERWGRVNPQGVSIRLPLTHEVLAMLVGAQRPTVTVALKRLAAEGLLERKSQRQWLLTRAAVERLRDVASVGVEPPAEQGVAAG